MGLYIQISIKREHYLHKKTFVQSCCACVVCTVQRAYYTHTTGLNKIYSHNTEYSNNLYIAINIATLAKRRL